MSADEEVQLLREAFEEVIRPALIKPFGGRSRGYEGWHDDGQGVQWNTGIDHDGMSPYLGVNLEGMKYDGWPIARLIQHEIADAKLPAIIGRLRQPEEVEVWWWLDAWQASARPRIAERVITPSPIRLGSRAAGDEWRRALHEARSCLEAGRGHLGRARQMVTLASGNRVERQVSPHLQFRLRPWRHAPAGHNARIGAMQAARHGLQSIYDFVKARCA